VGIKKKEEKITTTVRQTKTGLLGRFTFRMGISVRTYEKREGKKEERKGGSRGTGYLYKTLHLTPEVKSPKKSEREDNPESREKREIKDRAESGLVTFKGGIKDKSLRTQGLRLQP